MNIRLIGAAAVAILAMAGCATTSPNYGTSSPPASNSGACYDCGTVARIDMVGSGGTPRSGVTGAVLGGVVGAAAGRELADDESDGRQNTATVVGSVAGAAAGAAIERNVEGANPQRPLLYELCNEHIKIGGDNPDNRYYAAAVDPRYR